ncbi:MAG: hypothetical protein H6R18_757 [Proteobacteria bacterium]|nr:hypothetical protein [Pseudomonadota bacterium]
MNTGSTLKEITMKLKNQFARFLFCCMALLAINGACLAQEPAKEPTMKDRIYFFQHRLIPQWTHQSGGAFFNDLNAGKSEKLIEAATKIVSPEFAAAISVKKYPDKNGILIRFAVPVEVPQCYFAYIYKDKNDNKFSLYTYEKTLDLLKEGNKGVVGLWSAEGGHSNLGARTYEDPESFVGEVQKAIQR